MAAVLVILLFASGLTAVKPRASENTIIEFNQVNEAVQQYLDDTVYTQTDVNTTAVMDYTSEYRNDLPYPTILRVPSSAVRIRITDGEYSLTVPVSGRTYMLGSLIPERVYTCTFCNASGEPVGSGLYRAKGCLRMIDAGATTFNIRDLGGWSCDGGTLRYNLLFRGCELSGDNYHVTLSQDQKKLFTDFLGIRDEIDMRSDSEVDGEDGVFGTADDITSSALGDRVDYIRRPIAPYASGINLNSIVQTEYYAALMKRVINDVCAEKPCYMHCMAGADRTGTFCALIEAICGVSAEDIDKEYELTSFSVDHTRTRTGKGWRAFMDALDEFPGDSLRDKAIAYALSAGVTLAEINALRCALIDGSPEPIGGVGEGYLIGDADGSGEVNICDATVIQRYLSAIKVLFPEEIIMHGDIDGNGNLEIFEATLIQRWLIEIPVPYSIGELRYAPI